MKKFIKKSASVLMLLVVLLIVTGCQTSVVRQVTNFTDEDGAGSRTISVAVFLDGSCQLNTNGEQGGDNWFVPAISNDSIKEGELPCNTTAALVSTAKDNGLVVPGNPDATISEKWDALHNFVMENLSSEEFPITRRVLASSNWNDEMMTNPELNADKTEFKLWVYEIEYSWNDFDEYISKTKALIGEEAWEISDLKQVEDDQQAWTTWTKTKVDAQDGKGKAYKVDFSERETVLYWSVYSRLLTVFESPNFDKTALGTEFDDYFFTLSDVEYKLGEESKVTQISHLDDVDEDGIKTITLSYEFPISSSNVWVYIVVIVVVAAIAGVIVFFIKRKKQI